jgi:holo-[acyl-carrier protein] synthase
MVYGIGADIVAVARLEAFYARHGEMGLEKILAPTEREHFRQGSESGRGRFLAKRWAAKEAFGKALGTGIRPPAILTAIAVHHDALGKPCFAFAAELEKRLDALGLRAHLSLSDEARYAVAFVILESA